MTHFCVVNAAGMKVTWRSSLLAVSIVFSIAFVLLFEANSYNRIRNREWGPVKAHVEGPPLSKERKNPRGGASSHAGVFSFNVTLLLSEGKDNSKTFAETRLNKETTEKQRYGHAPLQNVESGEKVLHDRDKSRGGGEQQVYKDPRLAEAQTVANLYQLKLSYADESNFDFEALPPTFQQCLMTGKINPLRKGRTKDNILMKIKQRRNLHRRSENAGTFYARPAHLSPSAGSVAAVQESVQSSSKGHVSGLERGVSGFPRFHLISSISTDHVDDMDTRAIANVKCYAKLHGYKHTLNKVDKSSYHPYHFFTARWSSVLERYAGDSDWLLVMDTDTINTNFSASLLKLEEVGKEVDLVLHVRTNTEVVAGFVALRGDTLFSACFLDYWMKYDGKYRHANDDNGALLEVLLRLLDVDLYNECRRTREKEYFSSFLPCFSRLGKKLEKSHEKLPIKVLFPFEGLWHPLEGPHAGNIVSHCFSTGGFAHGMKKMGEHFVTEEQLACDVSESALFQPNRRCKWLGILEEMELVKECCFFKHPRCKAVSVDGSGRDVCGIRSQCTQSSRGIFGTGVCKEDSIVKEIWPGDHLEI
eukprot:CAMPEP_0113874206 /NCGR_PEP_ID=MMETSP0780_2-20120614/4201_1 /TAXON_ID=652834 /ORGANISM="Palpitomonas bilix" /LENGTH=587 /DNA_ID=CAMNT_0000859945 /DNA_START=185 /DNA_END=1949 /DNA_ORIENTATION=+ /assembly_acc=CAM_ASM_000599